MAWKPRRGHVQDPKNSERSILHGSGRSANHCHFRKAKAAVGSPCLFRAAYSRGEHSCFGYGYAQGSLAFGRMLLLPLTLRVSLKMRSDHPFLRFFRAKRILHRLAQAPDYRHRLQIIGIACKRQVSVVSVTNGSGADRGVAKLGAVLVFCFGALVLKR